MISTRKIAFLTGIGLATAGASWYAFTKIKRFIMTAEIVSTAKKFIGEMEIQPNMGFVNKAFEKIMRELGNWQPGFEWCACFARMVWLTVLTGEKHKIANRLLSPSSQFTYKNFAIDKSGLFEVSNEPKPGALVIWQSVKEPHKGHAGIFIAMLGNQYIVVEGNKGQKVSLVRYTPEKMLKPSNILKLRGFINIK
jgi:hypothetical protein